MTSGTSILVAELGAALWVRLDGRGDLGISPTIRQVAHEAQERGASRLVIDLEDCPMMDSTFMGTLAALVGAAESGGPKLELVNVGTRNRELFGQLGLDHVLDIDADGSAHEEEIAKVGELLVAREAEGVDRRRTAATSLEAHEALSEIEPENVERFRDVIDYLRKDLADADGSEG